MERLARILVPVDGSGASDQAVRFAAILADATGASVDILHVSYFDSSTDADEVSWLPESVAGPIGPEAEKILERAKRLIPDAVIYEAHHRTGSPAQTILDFAEERQSGLIVVGSCRLDALHAALLGSVSTQVLYEAKCPVTVVKEHPHPERISC